MWRGWSNGRSAELVGVAQPIARCGKCGGVCRRREVLQRRVRTLPVVVGDPCRDLGLRVVEIEEQRLVQEFAAHPPVKPPTKAVWIGLPGAMKCQSMTVSLHQLSIALQVNSVPLSE